MRADINYNGYLCKNYKIVEQKEVKASHRKLAGIMRQPEANFFPNSLSKEEKWRKVPNNL